MKRREVKMKKIPFHKGTLTLFALIIPLLALFAHVALRSGPLAPIPIVLTAVEHKSITPSLFGVGTVESRYTYKIGPTLAGRLKSIDVDVGDTVKADQTIGAMNVVDLNDRIAAQEAMLKRANAQLEEARTRHEYAKTQSFRYEQLYTASSATEELSDTKRHKMMVAKAGLDAAQEEISRISAEREALIALRNDLFLTAPADGLVVARHADPGTTMMAGQAVVELIEPDKLWVNVRFDQIKTRGLVAELPATVTLRSHAQRTLKGHVLRVEPLADAITEETLAKVVFDQPPVPTPPIGELVEVTVILPSLPPAPTIPNAAIHVVDGKLGVWQISADKLQFTPVVTGDSDLEGHIQIHEGLKAGDQVVVYSKDPLSRRSRYRIVDQITGETP
jgi:HlyD family secretion protein